MHTRCAIHDTGCQLMALANSRPQGYSFQRIIYKMYIHIGSNKSVRACDIVAVFDLDTATVSVHTRSFLSTAQREGRVKALGTDLPKSFIIMKDNTIYLSPFNTATISKDILFL